MRREPNHWRTLAYTLVAIFTIGGIVSTWGAVQRSKFDFSEFEWSDVVSWARSWREGDWRAYPDADPPFAVSIARSWTGPVSDAPLIQVACYQDARREGAQVLLSGTYLWPDTNPSVEAFRQAYEIRGFTEGFHIVQPRTFLAGLMREQSLTLRVPVAKRDGDQYREASLTIEFSLDGADGAIRRIGACVR